MRYLCDTFNLLMLNEKEFDHSMKIKTISKNEAKRRLGEIEGYESLIEDEKSINILSETLEINIKSSKGQKEFTPLGNISYSEAKKEAFLAGVRIPYDVYDIYFI